MSEPEAFSFQREPLITASRTSKEVSDDVIKTLEDSPSRLWWISFITAGLVLLLGMGAVIYRIKIGVGTWGLNKTVGWSWDITSFVFWVGIGHAGTLISAILLLLRQKWRTSINRAAEAMTIFAIMCAGVYPIIHMGRPWVAYWLFPYPNSRLLWVNFRSPLVWDVFAISTYFSVSALFWYIGMIPDLASMRDRSRGIRKTIYSLLSLGWNGSHRTWHRYEILCLILAGLATPLVVSVHTIVSMDFATSILPGWHSTIFPPYFVAGAVFSGFAMVLTLLIVARKIMNFENYITVNHIEAMCKILLATGLMVGLAYITEVFMAWYSGNEYERFAYINRSIGPYAWAYWMMVIFNVLIPQFLWIKKIRRSMLIIFIISLLVNIGMWLERFVIITTSLHRDFLPSSWVMYSPTWVEIATFMGSIGLFFFMFLLFIRFLPAIAVFEIKSVMNYGRREKP